MPASICSSSRVTRTKKLVTRHTKNTIPKGLFHQVATPKQHQKVLLEYSYYQEPNRTSPSVLQSYHALGTRPLTDMLQQKISPPDAPATPRRHLETHAPRKLTTVVSTHRLTSRSDVRSQSDRPRSALSPCRYFCASKQLYRPRPSVSDGFHRTQLGQIQEPPSDASAVLHRQKR